jgi:hypothetical protein
VSDHDCRPSYYKTLYAITQLVLRAVGLAMGVVVVVMSILNAGDPNTWIILLGIGLFCLGLSALNQINEKDLENI